MAARDGSYREGFYHFKCESCGAPATARRAHARVCSSTCAARLRRKRAAPAPEPSAADGAPTEFRFYISQRKLESILGALGNGAGRAPELIVGFDRNGRGPELARLRIDATDHDDGGLVCCLTAPYDPFGESRRTRGSEAG